MWLWTKAMKVNCKIKYRAGVQKTLYRRKTSTIYFLFAIVLYIVHIYNSALHVPLYVLSLYIHVHLTLNLLPYEIKKSLKGPEARTKCAYIIFPTFLFWKNYGKNRSIFKMKKNTISNTKINSLKSWILRET